MFALTDAPTEVDIFDVTLGILATAESFFHDTVSISAPIPVRIDLTFGYNLVVDGSGGFGFDFAIGGAVPQALDLGDDADRLRLLRPCNLPKVGERARRPPPG